MSRVPFSEFSASALGQLFPAGQLSLSLLRRMDFGLYYYVRYDCFFFSSKKDKALFQKVIAGSPSPIFFTFCFFNQRTFVLRFLIVLTWSFTSNFTLAVLLLKITYLESSEWGLYRGGRYRSVNLPPPNFFSQFLPPPYFFGPFRPPP